MLQHRPLNLQADIAATLRCLDETLDLLAQYGTIQVMDRKSARIAFYTPRPLRNDAIQIHPGIHRLNWPDRRRRRSSHTFQQWLADLETRELAATHTRYRAVALFDRTLTLETEGARTLYRWMRSQWQHHALRHPHVIPDTSPSATYLD